MENSFLTNYSGQTFLDRIKADLSQAQEFYLSVSFIKKAGLVLLAKDIEAALRRGCQGRVITSTYQNFTDIDSLNYFMKLTERYPGFACHLDFNCFQDNQYATLGYHTKGYLFAMPGRYEIIVGSSNITRYALLKNIEWDVALADAEMPSSFAAARAEFDRLWAQTRQLDTKIIGEYTSHLNFAIERWDMDYNLEGSVIKPNSMQRKALKELSRYRDMGKARALVVAAAGSGKTYLAAFDAYNFGARKLLYIVHEGSILRRSMETFRAVFGTRVTMGEYDGTAKDATADFVFATNFTMSRSLELFSRSEFDYIIVDECHHATAETYRRIISYFQPEFLLGLTATPERMDNADVLEMFDENVPYELRLRDAIANDLVVPFHYYGIRDKLIEYDMNDKDERRFISEFADEDNVGFIISQIEARRPRQGKLKAIAFCRNVTHAMRMAAALGERYQTAYLTGGNNIVERQRAYQELQSDDTALQMLFTVDILNEGVDIPGVNMVLFLRPTESSTIFIQQLGRGLRKYEGKEYLTVLDFIGNGYRRSVQIAFALGSLSQNFVIEKYLLRSLVNDDFAALGLGQYGVRIDIDELSKEEMIRYLDQENLNSRHYLEKNYKTFKDYIGTDTYPRHMDYINNDCAPDLLTFMNVKIEGRKARSYYCFLAGIGETGLPVFSQAQIDIIDYLSEMLPLVRPYEYLIFQALIDQRLTGRDDVRAHVASHIEGFETASYDHAMRFILKNGYLVDDGHYRLTFDVDGQLKEYLDDLLSYGLARYTAELGDTAGRFKLWANYRKDQVQLMLCKNPESKMLGTYVYDGDVYIFAALRKDESLEEHLKYNDRFISASDFQWECQAGLSVVRQQELIDSRMAYLFIRKVDVEYGVVLPFTYVGKGKLTNPRQSNNPKGSLLFDVHIDQPLPDYLQYDYGLAGSSKEAA